MTTSAMRRLVASVLGAMVALAGALVAPAAWATDGPTVTVSQASRDGGKVTITGKGFATEGTGVYVAVAPSSVKQFYGNSDKFVGYDPNKPMTESASTIWVYPPAMKAVGSKFTQGAPMAADGSFTIKMYVPAFEKGKGYVVLTSKAHGVGMRDKSDDTRTPVTYQAAPVPPAPKPSIAPSTPVKPSTPSKSSMPSKSSVSAKPSPTLKSAPAKPVVTTPAPTAPSPGRSAPTAGPRSPPVSSGGVCAPPSPATCVARSPMVFGSCRTALTGTVRPSPSRCAAGHSIPPPSRAPSTTPGPST